MSPVTRPNHSGTDNLGNYLILPFFAACWAYFLEYQMRPAVKIRQARGEAASSNSASSAAPPAFPSSSHSFGRPLDHTDLVLSTKDKPGGTQAPRRRRACGAAPGTKMTSVASQPLRDPSMEVVCRPPLSMEFQEYWEVATLLQNLPTSLRSHCTGGML